MDDYSTSELAIVPAPQRTSEEVSAAAQSAGLPPSSLPVQLLYFGAHPNSNEYKLLQLSGDVLNSLKTEGKLVIRGDRQDEAVLCTSDKTFELRQAHTSNSLLLCPSLHYPKDKDLEDYHHDTLLSKEVSSCVFKYFELRHCQPKYVKLKELLLENPYCGELEERMQFEEEPMEIERNVKVNKYTFSDLLNTVQASEVELQEGLCKLQACLINGYWRIFDLDYRDQVFQHILTLIEEEDWSWKSVPFEKCCEKLKDLEPSFALEHCLKCYGIKHCGEEGDIRYELLEDKVCQFYGELLLRPAGKFNYQEFLDSWQESVPIGMTTGLHQLKGLALTDMQSVPPVIWHFPASSLPDDPTARFTKLFRVKEKWTYEDLEPYIKGMESPGQSLNALLLKFCRVSTNPQGVKMYNARLSLM